MLTMKPSFSDTLDQSDLARQYIQSLFSKVGISKKKTSVICRKSNCLTVSNGRYMQTTIPIIDYRCG